MKWILLLARIAFVWTLCAACMAVVLYGALWTWEIHIPFYRLLTASLAALWCGDAMYQFAKVNFFRLPPAPTPGEGGTR